MRWARFTPGLEARGIIVCLHRQAPSYWVRHFFVTKLTDPEALAPQSLMGDCGASWCCVSMPPPWPLVPFVRKPGVIRGWKVVRTRDPTMRLKLPPLICQRPAAAPACAPGGLPPLTHDPGIPGPGHGEINIASLPARVHGSAFQDAPASDFTPNPARRGPLRVGLPCEVAPAPGEGTHTLWGSGLFDDRTEGRTNAMDGGDPLASVISVCSSSSRWRGQEERSL